MEKPSLRNLRPERQPQPADYFFLAPAVLAATACFFFWSALLAAACFWVDFFWLDFGDRSPMDNVVRMFTRWWNRCFSTSTATLT